MRKYQVKSVINRDDEWLKQQLKDVWVRHFADIQEYNQVKIVFGKRARRRLGSISIDSRNPGITIIRVTGWFKHPEVPVFMVRSVIVHEMCHYAHGFHSGGTKLFKHPHAGGVIRNEFKQRQLEDLYDKQQQWLKNHWPAFLQRHYKPTHRPRQRTRIRLSFFG